jgi:hypothetical protein
MDLETASIIDIYDELKRREFTNEKFILFIDKGFLISGSVTPECMSAALFLRELLKVVNEGDTK